MFDFYKKTYKYIELVIYFTSIFKKIVYQE